MQINLREMTNESTAVAAVALLLPQRLFLHCGVPQGRELRSLHFRPLFFPSSNCGLTPAQPVVTEPEQLNEALGELFVQPPLARLAG